MKTMEGDLPFYRTIGERKEMSMKWIRDLYKVPAKRGMKVIAQGERGTIVGSRNGYLRIRIDGRKNVFSFHPTDDIKYLAQIGVKELNTKEKTVERP
jgi:hypothetical protein